MKGFIPAIVFMAGAPVASCSHGTGELLPAKEFPADSVAWSDTIVCEGENSFSSIRIKYPTAASPSTDSIAHWIAAQLDAKGEVAAMKIPEMAHAVGKANMDSIRVALADEEECYGITPVPPQIATWQIEPIFSNGRCVTYSSNEYIYQGGAHGATQFRAQVFAVPSGREIGYDMFMPDSLERVREIVLNGIKDQYFESASQQEFEEVLLEPIENIGLPEMHPYFTETGIGFLYQQYEIAPYSEGMPSCVIPYSTLKPLLSPAALHLLYD